MTCDDIIKLALEAGFCKDSNGIYSRRAVTPDSDLLPSLERFATLVAAEKEQQMIRDGWRQCAKGQRTTQYCGLLDAAVKDERDACAKVAEAYEPRCEVCPSGVSTAIRARGET
jgi:hypothetical protein